MKAPLLALLILSTGLPSQFAWADQLDRVRDVVQPSINEGVAQKAQIRGLFGLVDQSLAKTQGDLERAIANGDQLKKINFVVDGLTVASTVSYLALYDVVRNPVVGKPVVAVYYTAFWSTVSGLILGQALQIGRDAMTQNLPAHRVREFATMSLAQLQSVQSSQLPPQIQQTLVQVRQDLTDLKAHPGNQDHLQNALHGISTLSFFGGLAVAFQSLSRLGFMGVGADFLPALAVTASSSISRLGSYLAPDDQQNVLAHIKAIRQQLRRSAEALR